MDLAMVGLGKMGMNMATRLARGGHRVVGYARTDATVKEAIRLGAEGAYTLEEVVSKLTAPRIIWLMIPTVSSLNTDVVGLGLNSSSTLPSASSIRVINM